MDTCSRLLLSHVVAPSTMLFLDILQGAFIYQLQLHATIRYFIFPICECTFLLDIRCPQFPETIIAFGNNCKRQGIACHHPKLIVLQRKDSIQIVITSANLVEKQVFYEPNF